MWKCLLPSIQETPPRQLDDPVHDIQERDDITSRALHLEQVARGLESMDTSSSQVIHLCFLSSLALRKESPSVKTAEFSIE